MSLPPRTILGSAAGGPGSTPLGSSSGDSGHGESPPRESVLARLRTSSVSSAPSLTPLQTQVDGLVTHFVQEAASPTTLAAMMAGGIAYRFGRIGIMASGASATGHTATFIRGLSFVGGLGAEVSTFELTSRGLTTLSGDRSNPNLWSLRGQGGLLQGLASSTVTFGLLKGAGHLSREQNLIFQHAFQSGAMVLGHNTTGLIGLTPRPEGTLAEQLLHAEATNIQLGAGMSLVHTAAPGIAAFERGLDISLSTSPSPLEGEGVHLRRTGEGSASLRTPFLPSFAMALSANGSVPSKESARQTSPRRNPLGNPHILMMEGQGDGGGKGPENSGGGGGGRRAPSYEDLIRQRLPLVSSTHLAEREAHLRREWDAWTGKSSLEPDTRGRLEHFFAHYLPFALAHFGREIPSHLPFLQEMYAMAATEFRKSRGENLSDEDRSAWIRFLNEQPGRRGEELGSDDIPALPFTGARLSLEDTRALLGKTFEDWEDFLIHSLQTVSLHPSERAQFHQRGLALLHFYAASLSARHDGRLPRPFHEMPLERDLLAQTLQEAASHPYPSHTVELFPRFFREVLGQTETASIPPPQTPERGWAHELDPLEISDLDFLSPERAESWPDYLIRQEINRNQLDEAHLSLTGATIFSWGSREESPGRLAPPGDILHLLGVLTYLNETGGRRFDPFDVLRLTLPQQLGSLRPDAEGRIIIRYPALMKDLNYTHFRLGALLRSHIQSSGAHDLDLARQWGVSEGTVSDYRRGLVKKMRIEILERLADSLADRPDVRQDMMNLLMFLRYRPYFEATMSILDNDGSPLNRKPPVPSRFQLVLIPHDEALRPLDTNRRIRFEREPFASALNGAVDLSLNLLETRRAEFELVGEAQLPLGDETLTLENYSERLAQFRSRHAEFFQLLSQQSQSPGIVRPGQIRDIQEFYREFFRFFERVHLHTRPRGRFTLGETSLFYEIVPPTLEQPRGVSILPGLGNSARSHAFVVAADLIENGRGFSNLMQRDLLHLRIVKEYLRSQNLLLPGEEHRDLNRALLARSLEGLPRFTENPEISWNDLMEISDRLERQGEEWSAPFIQPSEQAVLHRITRGKLQQGGAERRLTFWKEDLRNFLTQRRCASLAPILEGILETYLQNVPHPFLGLNTDAFGEATKALRALEGDAEAETAGKHLLEFMSSVGLPTEEAPPPSSPLSPEGFSQLAFATYLKRFQDLHPFGRQGTLFEDENLLDRVLNDRLIDATHLTPQRDRIVREVRRLIDDYNGRNPPLHVFEIKAEGEETQEPLSLSPLARLYRSTLDEESNPQEISERWIYAALSEVDTVFERGETPSQSQRFSALERSRARLEGVVDTPKLSTQAHLEFFSRLTQKMEAQRQALARLALRIPDFVSQERYQSGLDNSRRTAEDLQTIFSRHLLYAMAHPTPLSLRQVILERISGRFGPYSSIREDVLKDHTVLYFEFLKSLRQEAHQLEQGLDLSLSYARDHRNREKFWNDFLGWAQTENPRLIERDALVRHLDDLDLTLPLFSRTELPSLRRRLHQALEEMIPWSTVEESSEPHPSTAPEDHAPSEAEIPLQPVSSTARKSEPPRPEEIPAASEIAQKTPPPLDLPRLLASPLSEERTAHYPELALVTEEALTREVTEERRHLAEPAGRDLLQLIALLKQFEPQLSSTARDHLEHLILDAETSSENLQDITRGAFETYDKIRSELINHIPLLDRVGLLPEIRGQDTRITGEVVGRRVQRLISERRFSGELQKRWVRDVESQIPLILDGNLEGYGKHIARFFEENREAILKSQTFYPLEDDARPLDLSSPPSHLRARLEREAPELDLIPEEQLKEALDEARAAPSGLVRDFWSQGGTYLLLKIRCLFVRALRDQKPDPALVKPGQEFLHHYRRLNALAIAGSSLSHLAVRGTDQILEFYQRHRPVLLNQLVQTEGTERVLETFPEIRSASRENSSRGAAAANRMIRSATQPRILRALEQLLWTFTPPTEQTSAKDTEPLLQSHLAAISRYYLDHRSEFERAFRQTELPLSDESGRKVDLVHQLWELSIYPEEASLLRQRGMAEALFQSQNSEPLFVFRFFKDNQTIQEKLLSLGEISRIHQRFTEGDIVRFEDDPDLTLRATDKTFTILITPFYQMRLKLGAHMPTDLFRLTEFLSPFLHPTLSEDVQREMDRGASLLLLGIEERWVMNTLQERILKTYEKYRESALSRLDFIPPVRELPEVIRIEKEEARDQATAMALSNRYSALKKLPPMDPANDLLFKIVALANWEGVPPRVGEDLERQLNRVQDKTSLALSLTAARFYYEHRKRILPHLPSGNPL